MTTLYTWLDFQYDARKIADAVVASTVEISCIYGIPRGGLVLAVYLSHALKKPLVIDDDGGLLPPHALVVDDNDVTGSALAPYKKHHSAVLVHNPHCPFVPTFIGRVAEGWPRFPWEVA